MSRIRYDVWMAIAANRFLGEEFIVDVNCFSNPVNTLRTSRNWSCLS